MRSGTISQCCSILLFVISSSAVAGNAIPPATSEKAAVSSSPEFPASIIPPDPAANGYSVASGERKLKQKLILEGHHLGTSTPLLWMDEHRFIVNYTSDKNETFSPGEGKGKQPRILVVNVDTGEITKTPYEGWLNCYRDGRISISRILYKEQFDKVAQKTWYSQVGGELAIGKYGEPLQIPVPGGWPKDLTLDQPSCQLLPKDPVAQKKRHRQAWGGGVAITDEMVTPVAESAADLGRFDKSQPFFRNMTVTTKEKWVWQGADGQEKVIETNPGEVFTPGHPVHLPFEGGAYFFPIRLDSTMPNPDFTPKFNRLVYPDGRVVRLPIPDLLWKEYVESRGRAGLGVWYSKAGVIWGKGGKPDSLMPRGLYLEDRINKKLIKLENFQIRDTTLFPDGCRMLIVRKAEHGGFYDNYIIDLCSGE